MSHPIDVYFVRNSEVVGVGRGNLGIAAEDTRIPGAIFDAWHGACERFEDEPECGRQAMDRFLEKYAHLFTTRPQLFEYQHIMIPSRRVIVGRKIVVDLLTQRLTSSDFAQIIDSPEFELTDRMWEAVMERTRIRRLISDPAVKASDVLREMSKWRRLYDVNAPETVDYYNKWFAGAANPNHIQEILREYQAD